MAAAVDLLANNIGEARVTGVIPAEHIALVTPDNSNDLGFVTRGIAFAVVGDLKITTVGGETVVIPSGSLAAGIIHPIRATRVFATLTTATGIVVYW